MPCFVFVTQTLSAENEGYNGPENDDEKAEPQSDEPLQADIESDVSEKEDKDEENVQFLPAIGFISETAEAKMLLSSYRFNYMG